MPINFNNFLFNYGGMDNVPFALYDKGTSQSFSLGCGSGTGMFDLGVEVSLEKGTLMGVDTTVTIPCGESRTLYYATAFLPFENPRIGLNFSLRKRVKAASWFGGRRVGRSSPPIQVLRRFAGS